MSSDGAGSFILATGLTKPEILRIKYAMMVLVSLFVLALLIFQATRCKKLELQNYISYFAFTCYLGACPLYITMVLILFKIPDVTIGMIAIPINSINTAGLTGIRIWAAQMCFYTCLWSVKVSLLYLYRKLLAGLLWIYIRIWWVHLPSSSFMSCAFLSSPPASSLLYCHLCVLRLVVLTPYGQR